MNDLVCRLSSQGTTDRVWHLVEKDNLLTDVNAVNTLDHVSHWEPLRPWMEEKIALLDVVLPDSQLAKRGDGRINNVADTVQGIGQKQLSNSSSYFSKEYYLYEPNW